MMTRTHKLDLLNNSISYFQEAVSYAQRDGIETNHWKYAILHVVQAMELAFKEYLRRIHPLFIYESIDKPEKTVSLKQAISRLRNPSIGNLSISDKEKIKLEQAFDLRNELTHFEFNHTHDHIDSKFAEIFAFMIFFYRDHLGLDTEDFVNEEQYQRILQLVKARNELLERVREYTGRDGIGDIWMCVSCGEDAFVVSERQCCLCHHKEDILSCEYCGEDAYKSDIIDTSSVLDWQFDEGRIIIENDYGLGHSACKHCIKEYEGKVEDLRRAQYYEDMEMDARSFSKA